MENIQSGAPMAAAAPQPIPLNAPSQSPTEPVTAGAALGPGIGPQAAGIPNDTDATLEQLAPLLRSMEILANLPSASPQTRSFVRSLRVQLASRQ